MAKKLWYEIEIECIKYKVGCSMLVGEKLAVAKVKSKGLAYSIAKHLADTQYTNDYFKVSIK